MPAVQQQAADHAELRQCAQRRDRELALPDAKLAHELADCLWSVLVLARAYGVDLEQAFVVTMDELEQRVRTQLMPEAGLEPSHQA